MNFELIESIEELCSHATDWDRLLQKSDSDSPLMSAECIQRHLQQFESGASFVAVVVKDDQDWVAALPMVRKTRWSCKTLEMLINPWSSSGDILVDSNSDLDEINRVLIEGLHATGSDALWLEAVEYESERWKRLAQQFQNSKMAIRQHPQFHIGYFDCDVNFEAYFARLSKSRRKGFRYALKQIQNQGKLTFEAHESPERNRVADLVQEAFELEHQGWKGEAKTSILSNPGMKHFYLEQAQRLNDKGQFAIYFLRLDGKLIAYDYGCTFKGVFFSQKVGYDENVSKYSPGHLLILKQLEYFHESRHILCVDTVGELSKATQSWITSSRLRGRMTVALNRKGAWLVKGFDWARNWKNRLRPTPELLPPKTIQPAKPAPEAESNSEIEAKSSSPDRKSDSPAIVTIPLNSETSQTTEWI